LFNILRVLVLIHDYLVTLPVLLRIHIPSWDSILKTFAACLLMQTVLSFRFIWFLFTFITNLAWFIVTQILFSIYFFDLWFLGLADDPFNWLRLFFSFLIFQILTTLKNWRVTSFLSIEILLTLILLKLSLESMFVALLALILIQLLTFFSQLLSLFL
jgi:hypothetical protein